ncbi:hypothetical protein [Proteus terrae]|uniref:hypothetical protein n=1 Tax=Proteus terrae TaxID=1574161 RepID=UPI001BA77B7C|nr:hypothetical protein [Proteus terrae]
MEFTFFCSGFDCNSGIGVTSVSASDVTDFTIPEQHQNEVLRTAISEENIIKYLKSQGYLVTC